MTMAESGVASRDRAEDLRFGDLHVAQVAGVARLVAYGDVRVEIVFRAQGSDVVLGAEIISFAEAVVVVAGDGRGLVEEPGNAVVGYVVRLLIEITERHAGGGSQTEGEGGRHAVAAVEGDVAAGDSTFGSHHVHAEGGAFTQGGERHVDVGGGAAGSIGTAIEGAGEGCAAGWAFWSPD